MKIEEAIALMNRVMPRKAIQMSEIAMATGMSMDSDFQSLFDHTYVICRPWLREDVRRFIYEGDGDET